MRRENDLQKRKTGKFKVKMTFAILVLTALSIAEVYLMLNAQTEYLYLGAVGLVMLCFVYWIVDISFRMQVEDDAVHEKEYENLYKAEKVSYISMKQSFLDLENRLKGMEDLPVDDVIQSQKAIGKVTIQRNKESVKAVMEAQQELKERMDALEHKLNEFDGISERQQEILDSIHSLEVSIKEGLSGAAVSRTAMQDNQGSQEQDMPEGAAEEKQAEEASAGAMMTEEQIAELLSAQEPSTEEAVNGEVEEKQAEEASAGAMMTEEEIAKLLSEQEPPAEEVKGTVEEKEAEESSAGAMMTEEEIAKLLSEQEPLAEEEVKESVEEKQSEEPSAGMMMTEEEIAKLLASQEPAVAEAAGDAQTEGAQAEEEKPAMPDLSDPGHVMTPEEIAALLANM